MGMILRTPWESTSHRPTLPLLSTGPAQCMSLSTASNEFTSSPARGPPALELLVVLPAARAEVRVRLVLPPHVNAVLVRQSSRADGAWQQRAQIEDLHAGNSIRIYWGSLIRVLSLKAHQDHNSSHTDTSISPPASFLQNNPYTID